MPLSQETKEAAAYIADHAHGYRAVLALVDGVGEIAKLEALANEAEARINAGEKTETALNERIDTARQKAEDAESAILADRTAAQDELKQARADAAAIRAEAEADAKALIGDARARANGELKKARDERQAVISGTDAEIADKRAALAEEGARLDDLRGETADLEERVRQAREFIANLKG